MKEHCFCVCWWMYSFWCAVWLICHHTCIYVEFGWCWRQFTVSYFTFRRAIFKTSVYLFRQFAFYFSFFFVELNLRLFPFHMHSVSIYLMFTCSFLHLSCLCLLSIVCFPISIWLILIWCCLFFLLVDINRIVKKKRNTDATMHKRYVIVVFFLSVSRADQAIYSMQCAHISFVWFDVLTLLKSYFVVLPQYHYYHYHRVLSSGIVFIAFYFLYISSISYRCVCFWYSVFKFK